MKGKLAEGADIDLGLAVAGLHARRGVPMTVGKIAAFCGCSRSYIQQIEERALRKLRVKLQFHKDQTLRELVETLEKR